MDERIIETTEDMSRTDKLEMVARLFSKAMFHGDWIWETPNERTMEMLLRELGYWPFEDEDDMIKKTPVPEGLYKLAIEAIPTRPSLNRGDKETTEEIEVNENWNPMAQASRAVSKEVRKPKCIRDGVVKPIGDGEIEIDNNEVRNHLNPFGEMYKQKCSVCGKWILPSELVWDPTHFNPLHQSCKAPPPTLNTSKDL